MFAVAFYCLHNVKFHVLGAAITASVLPSDGAMTVKTVESVEIGFRSRWTSVEVVNSRDGHRSTWFRSKWKSVEVTYNLWNHTCNLCMNDDTIEGNLSWSVYVVGKFCLLLKGHRKSIASSPTFLKKKKNLMIHS